MPRRVRRPTPRRSRANAPNAQQSEGHDARRPDLRARERDLDAIERVLWVLAAIRRLLADLVPRVPDPTQRRRFAAKLEREFGLIATRLEAAPRDIPAKESVSALSRVLAPAVTRGMQFSGGRRAGSLDALDRVLVDILTADPRMHAKDVLGRLKERAGSGVVVRIRDESVRRAIPRPRDRGSGSQRGLVVVWNRPTQAECRTAWASITNRRLPRLRKLVLAKSQ